MPRNGLDVAKRIYDCVHGYIDLTKVELDVVDTPAFQRLHNVRQLGLSYLVYPTAQHTRFSHSLGVLHVASEFIDALRENSTESGPLDNQDTVQELRLAALLHDVGHHPFSHLLEKVMGTLDGLESEHTLFAKWIIENTSIKDCIADYDSKRIQSIICRSDTEHVCNSIVSSDLDADRLDYLLRDAYFTGVALGAIDIHRLLRIARIKEHSIVYDVKGLPPIESYLMARMSMYRAVYYQKTSTGFGLLLKRAYADLRKKKRVHSLDDLKKLDEHEFAAYGDSYIIDSLRERAKEDDEVGKMARFVIERKPLKLADVVYSYQTGSEGYTRLAPMKYDKPLRGVAEEAGISPDWLFYERVASKFVELEESPIMIYDPNDLPPVPITKYQKSAIKDLIDKVYFEDRVYTIPGKEADVRKAIRAYFGK